MTPIAAARASLLGLSVGDGFGAALDLLASAEIPPRAASRTAPDRRPWSWTDDTAMAIVIVDELARRGTLDPDALAAGFAERFVREPDRGYGAGAFSLLMRVAAGAPWRDEVARMFGGEGSLGNGGAMRAPPVGAFFARDLATVRDEALRSAAPTHAHPDGAAGAVAIAIAAALAQARAPRDAILAEVVRWTPDGPTRDGLTRAAALDLDTDPVAAVHQLGAGTRVTAADTVPFAVWIAARHLDSYEDAVWAAAANAGAPLDDPAAGRSDRDTLGAIVGGIVVCATGIDAIPRAWRDATEPLPVS